MSFISHCVGQRWSFVSLALALFAGCGRRADEGTGPQATVRTGQQFPDQLRNVLESDPVFELLTLEPDRVGDKPREYYGYEILGRAPISKERGYELIRSIKQGMAESQYSFACFEPRHGLRLTANDSIVDIVICFECQWIKVYVGDNQIADFHTSKSPSGLFNLSANELGLELAP